MFALMAADFLDGTQTPESVQVTIREVSGGIIGSALIIFGIGASGLLKAMLMYISPLTGTPPPLQLCFKDCLCL